MRHLVSHGYILPAGQVPGGSIRGNKFGYGQFGKGGKARTASDTVVKALRAGSRDGLTREEFRYVATVRERRFLDAARDYEEALRGKNPYASGRAWERAREQGIQKGRQWAQLEPLTKDDVKWAETNYRIELQRYLAPWSGKDFQLRARFPELFTLGPGRLPKKRVSSGAGVVSAVKGKTSGKKTTGSKTTGSKVGVKQKPGVPVLATGGAGGKPPRKPPVKSGGLPDPKDWKAVYDLAPLDSIVHVDSDGKQYTLLDKIIDGFIKRRATVGGHGYGKTVTGKTGVHTFFPRSWTKETVREAYKHVLQTSPFVKGGTYQYNGMYKGVELVLRIAVEAPNPAKTVVFYPKMS
ncbi:hypothetical protein R6G86_07780 [Actinotignum urinale]|uniref:Bacterial EndoU nuclease domain-containing protein n=1 Tax=Actinotignum urinale TaxID=190146 RepID=A0ABU5G8J1_9ACTO|nr:hypothetical protein [Actinotignum urinale]